MKTGLKLLLSSAFFAFLIINEVYGQPLPPAGQTPIDPVSWVLLGAAGAYAGKKYYNSRKEQE